MKDDTPDVIAILNNARLEEIARLRADNAKLRAYLGALVVMLDEVNTHIDAAHNHLETADFILDTHELYCTAPKWDGPDTVEEARL